MTHFSFITTYIYPFIGIILLAVSLFGLFLLVELVLYLSLKAMRCIIRKVKRYGRHKKKKRRLHRRK